MFYLRKIDLSAQNETAIEDEFGWWIGDQKPLVPKRSVTSFADWQENGNEKDADWTNEDCSVRCKNERLEGKEQVRGHCYTPERIVELDSYRILTPSPKFLSLPETTSTKDMMRSQEKRRKIAGLIDDKCNGLSDPKPLEFPEETQVLVIRKTIHDPETDRNVRAFASVHCGNLINGVVTMLNSLENDPRHANYLLEEDKFYGANSSHDQLTRLALTIEPDGDVTGIIDDPGNLLRGLRGKVSQLEDASREIHREIQDLKVAFQQDEWRINHLSTVAREFREDIHEMRYLDDLLSLLQGELERISRRNWPFAVRCVAHDPHEKNLII